MRSVETTTVEASTRTGVPFHAFQTLQSPTLKMLVPKNRAFSMRKTTCSIAWMPTLVPFIGNRNYGLVGSHPTDAMNMGV
jgi:hypothetical protein